MMKRTKLEPGQTVGMWRLNHVIEKKKDWVWERECMNCGAKGTVTTVHANRKLAAQKCMNCWGMPKGQAGFQILFYNYVRSCSRGKDRIIPFELGVTEFRELTSSHCHYCGAPPATVSKSNSDWSVYLYNGIDRKDSSGGYTTENCVPCCGPCNKAKHIQPYDQFIRYLDHLTAYRSQLPSGLPVVRGSP